MGDSAEHLAKIFYNKKKLPKMGPAIIKGVRKMRKMSVPFTTYQSNILGETDIWKVFYRQSPATDYASKAGMNLMVFAFESNAVGSKGKRNYVVAHPKKLWNILSRRPASYRCTYEVIPEDHICKLYFDIEFFKEFNAKANGSELVQTFIKIVNYYLKVKFNINTDIKDVLILDSTTEKKFSRHLIYNSNFSFINNKHAGRFVIYVYKQLKNMHQTGHCDITGANIHLRDINEMFIKKERRDAKNDTLICDLSVYSKNRNFRTYKSTKYLLDAPLCLALDNKYVPMNCCGPNEENYFFDSLITYIPNKTKILQCEDETKSGLETNMKLIKCSKNSDICTNSNHSPLPIIDDFIESLLGKGAIRNCQYHKDEVLVFDISRDYRFCHNINREHKSNGIMYVVNIKKGIYYQKCHDPDCQDFRSNEWYLPSYIIQFLNISYIEEDLNDEALLINAVEEAEKGEKEKQFNETQKIALSDPSHFIKNVSDEEMIEVVKLCEHQSNL